MKFTWANATHTQVLVEDDDAVPPSASTMPADPANPRWVALAARVDAGEVVIADFAPAGSKDSP